MPDGRIFCTPGNVTVGYTMIYDPAANTTTRTTTGFGGNGWSNGGVLMADGRVFCVPGNATNPQIYNPITDRLSGSSAVVYPGGGAYIGGVLLPDGRVFCVPYNATAARIYGGKVPVLGTRPDPNVVLSPYWNH